MPSFKPFEGLIYNPEKVVIDDVISPPYDVVNEEDRRELVSHSDHNSILIELPVESPASGDQAASGDRYEAAARLLASWVAGDVVTRDPIPAMYAYQMDYSEESGRPRKTLGVIGALGLEDEGDGEILPHEQTLPKAKGDRLFLLRTAKVNTSPIWGLSLAAGLSELTEAACESGKRAGPDLVATDAEGVRHSLWRITDAEDVAAIADLVSSQPVVIADGHHRFETALAYRKERREALNGLPGDYDAVMALVVELSEEELLVRPIHRLIRDLPDASDLLASLGQEFKVSLLTTEVDTLDAGALSGGGAMVLVTTEGAWLLGEGDPMAEGPQPSGGGQAEAILSELDSYRLSLALDKLPVHEISYEAELDRALGAVMTKEADAAILLRPASVELIARAGSRQTTDAPEDDILPSEAPYRNGDEAGRGLSWR